MRATHAEFLIRSSEPANKAEGEKTLAMLAAAGLADRLTTLIIGEDSGVVVGDAEEPLAAPVAGEHERGVCPLAPQEPLEPIAYGLAAGVMASIEVAQTFINTTGTPIEATYIFPLPDRAAPASPRRRRSARCRRA